MGCERCAGRGFELVGVEAGGVVALRCDRCGEVQRVVADPQPPSESAAGRSRYRERRGALGPGRGSTVLRSGATR